MTQVSPSDCNVKIVIYVDTAKARTGSTQGIYMVDNRAPKSSNEGTASLNTYCNTNDYICWRVMPIDPDTHDTVAITSFDQSLAWGYGGKPQASDTSNTVWVGRAENSGCYQTPINLIISENGKNPVQLKITPSLNING
ncbi:MAG TPA: hypothetical protein VHP38_08550 [Ruminiclostridium sp.]|nr:hypothetical protein [Ruminiclostridium sp.]